MLDADITTATALLRRDRHFVADPSRHRSPSPPGRSKTQHKTYLRQRHLQGLHDEPELHPGSHPRPLNAAPIPCTYSALTAQPPSRRYGGNASSIRVAQLRIG